MRGEEITMDDRQNTYDDSAQDAQDNTPRVAALSDLGDFQVAEGYPDPRGWDVMASGGKKVGKVHDLIVDTAQMRTRYLDIKLDRDATGTDDDRDVLVPVGAARLDDGDDNVVLDSLSAAQVAVLPAFTHGEITREYENSVLGHMPGGETGVAAGAATGAAAAESDYYATHHFDDNRFFSSRDRMKNEAGSRAGMTDTGTDQTANEARVTRSEEELEIGKRQVQGGEVDVRKRVETEHVSQPVMVSREQVTIERRPIRADQAGTSTANIGEDNEIRIPITEEEVVVDKRAVVKEELVIKKHMVTENQTVEADLRKERVDVDRSKEQSGLSDATTRDSNANRPNR